MPSLVIDELAPGQEPQASSFDDFARALGIPPEVLKRRYDERDQRRHLDQTILDGIGRALEIPPEILKLRFIYGGFKTTATALTAFELYLDDVRETWGQDFVPPNYVEWLCQAWCLSDWRTSVPRSLPLRKEEAK